MQGTGWWSPSSEGGSTGLLPRRAGRPRSSRSARVAREVLVDEAHVVVLVQRDDLPVAHADDVDAVVLPRLAVRGDGALLPDRDADLAVDEELLDAEVELAQEPGGELHEAPHVGEAVEGALREEAHVDV